MSSDPTECFGTLLVHSSDMKEFSERTQNDDGSPVECVGSLLVHSTDVQELSEKTTIPIELPTVNLRQRVTAGTLLVKPDDVRSPEEEDHGKKGGVSIQKRLTNTLQGPAPGDDEADTWAD